MAITDQAVLTEIQRHFLETPDNGATWPSGKWTVSEVPSYLSQRQNQFLRDTKILLTRAQIAVLPNIFRHSLPTTWIVTQRVAWKAADGSYTEVPRGDGWEADNGIPAWPTNQVQVPQLYTEGEVPTLQIQIMPAVSAPGELDILFVALPTAVSNTGIAFTVPDEFVPGVKWGAMADMLGKIGRAHDPERAAFCETRYQEAQEAARLMLEGWA